MLGFSHSSATGFALQANAGSNVAWSLDPTEECCVHETGPPKARPESQSLFPIAPSKPVAALNEQSLHGPCFSEPVSSSQKWE